SCPQCGERLRVPRPAEEKPPSAPVLATAAPIIPDAPGRSRWKLWAFVGSGAAIMMAAIMVLVIFGHSPPTPPKTNDVFRNVSDDEGAHQAAKQKAEQEQKQRREQEQEAKRLERVKEEADRQEQERHAKEKLEREQEALRLEMKSPRELEVEEVAAYPERYVG